MGAEVSLEKPAFGRGWGAVRVGKGERADGNGCLLSDPSVPGPQVRKQRDEPQPQQEEL